MDLKILLDGEKYNLYSPVSKGKITYFEEFINGLSSNYKSSIYGLVALMEQHVKNGPEVFNSKQCHYVNQKEKIYEYIKGDLRIFWFHDEGKFVICFHGLIKKTQKSTTSEVEKAIKLKKLYLKSKENNTLNIIEG